jgi:CDP-diglyceride synthetase
VNNRWCWCCLKILDGFVNSLQNLTWITSSFFYFCQMWGKWERYTINERVRSWYHGYLNCMYLCIYYSWMSSPNHGSYGRIIRVWVMLSFLMLWCSTQWTIHQWNFLIFCSAIIKRQWAYLKRKRKEKTKSKQLHLSVGGCPPELERLNQGGPKVTWVHPKGVHLS